MKKLGWISSILIIAIVVGVYFFNKTDETLGKEEPPQDQKESPKDNEDSNPIEEDNQSEDENKDEEEPVLSDSEMFTITQDLITQVGETFAELGSEHNWSSLEFEQENGKSKPDYSVARPTLLTFSTENFADNILKDILVDYYCSCDADFLPSSAFTFKYEVVEKASDSFTVKNFEPINLLEHGGYTMFYTVVKEDGTWKLNEWKKVFPDEESINVSVETYLDYYNREYPADTFGKLVFVETIEMDGSEIEKYNGGHPEPDGSVDVHVFYHEDYKTYTGVSAASTRNVSVQHIDQYKNEQ